MPDTLVSLSALKEPNELFLGPVMLIISPIW
jgi:hypothetical protein